MKSVEVATSFEAPVCALQGFLGRCPESERFKLAEKSARLFVCTICATVTDQKSLARFSVTTPGRAKGGEAKGSTASPPHLGTRFMAQTRALSRVSSTSYVRG